MLSILVTFEPYQDLDKWIEVRGEGISKGLVGIEAEFCIDYSGADKGSLSIESRGPAKLDLCCAYSTFLVLDPKINLFEGDDENRIDVTYTATLPGHYQVAPVVFHLLTQQNFQILVFYDNVQIDGSPFTIDIEPVGEKPLLVKCSGPGIESSKVNTYNDIYVDFTQAGLGELSLLVEGPRKK